MRRRLKRHWGKCCLAWWWSWSCKVVTFLEMSQNNRKCIWFVFPLYRLLFQQDKISMQMSVRFGKLIYVLIRRVLTFRRSCLTWVFWFWSSVVDWCNHHCKFCRVEVSSVSSFSMKGIRVATLCDQGRCCERLPMRGIQYLGPPCTVLGRRPGSVAGRWRRKVCPFSPRRRTGIGTVTRLQLLLCCSKDFFPFIVSLAFRDVAWITQLCYQRKIIVLICTSANKRRQRLWL